MFIYAYTYNTKTHNALGPGLSGVHSAGRWGWRCVGKKQIHALLLNCSQWTLGILLRLAYKRPPPHAPPTLSPEATALNKKIIFLSVLKLENSKSNQFSALKINFISRKEFLRCFVLCVMMGVGIQTHSL